MSESRFNAHLESPKSDFRFSSHMEAQLDSLDAAFFSGDAFHSNEGLARIEYFLERWKKEAASIKTIVGAK